jgi:hypothetical protein
LEKERKVMDPNEVAQSQICGQLRAAASGLASPVSSQLRKKHGFLSREEELESRAALRAARDLVQMTASGKAVSRLPPELVAVLDEEPTSVSGQDWPKIEAELRRRIAAGLGSAGVDGWLASAADQLVADDAFRRANPSQVTRVLRAIQSTLALEAEHLEASDRRVLEAASRWISDIDRLRGQF